MTRETPDVLAAIRGKATIPLWPDAARVLGCSRNVAYAAAAKGEIPTLRLGRLIRVPVPKLLEMLGATPDMSEAEPASPATA